MLLTDLKDGQSAFESPLLIFWDKFWLNCLIKQNNIFTVLHSEWSRQVFEVMASMLGEGSHCGRLGRLSKLAVVRQGRLVDDEFVDSVIFCSHRRAKGKFLLFRQQDGFK